MPGDTITKRDIEQYREHEREKAVLHKYKVLLLTTFIIAGSSIVYELLISAAETYLMGNAALYYAIVIGLYMASLGLGAFLSRFFKRELIFAFTCVEVLLAVIGGMSTLAIFEAFLHLPNHLAVMFFFVVSIGVLSGLEIPLLTRIIEEGQGERAEAGDVADAALSPSAKSVERAGFAATAESDNDGNAGQTVSPTSRLRLTLSAVMGLDYVGGLVGSVAFPLLLLPQLGYYSTAFVAGAINLTAAVIVVFRYQDVIGRSRAFVLKIVSAIVGVALVCGIVFAQLIAVSIEGGLYRDQVVLDQQSQYQHIVMTKHKDDIRLYLDGNLQFSSVDEKRYHESLVHVPMAVAGSRAAVLVLGGGDGLAAREILKYDDVDSITLVDLDPAMTELCSTERDIVALNKGSLGDPRLTIVNQDAYQYLQDTEETYDVIIVDLPDPNNDALAKLYSNVFYRLCSNVLNKDGAMVVQSTSPYSAKKTFWCIDKTIASEGFNVYPYHALVPSFGDWGFNLATKNPVDVSTISVDESVQTSFLDADALRAMFLFSKDLQADMESIAVNTMSKPVIMDYYNDAVVNWK